jgi:hypothetical protein
MTLACECQFVTNPGCVIYDLMAGEFVISISSLRVCDSTGQECHTHPLKHFISLQESCNYTVLQFINVFSHFDGRFLGSWKLTKVMVIW